jgi:hypothetical protein
MNIIDERIAKTTFRLKLIDETNNKLDLPTVYVILSTIAEALSKNPNQQFYLDQPFMNERLMNDFHDTLLLMERAEYIQGFHGGLTEGKSKQFPDIEHLGFQIQILEKGFDLLESLPKE